MKLILTLLLILCVSSAFASVTVFPQPWRENGANLREMISKPNDWKNIRKNIDTIGYWPWLMHAFHSAEEQRTFFEGLEKWNKKFCFEVPVLKGHTWCGTLDPLPDAAASFAFYLNLEKEFKNNGLKRVDYFAFDEPVYASITSMKMQAEQGELNINVSDGDYMKYGLKQTAKYIKYMREHCPDCEIMDIEPYPAMTLSQLKDTVMGLKRECEAVKTKAPEYMRIDVDWGSMEAGFMPGSWLEVKQFADFCHENNTKFSLIYWAANKPPLDGKNIEFDMQWYVGVMYMAETAKLIGLEPDEYVIESWIHMPNKFGPEKDKSSYAGTINDFLKLIGK